MPQSQKSNMDWAVALDPDSRVWRLILNHLWDFFGPRQSLSGRWKDKILLNLCNQDFFKKKKTRKKGEINTLWSMVCALWWSWKQSFAVWSGVNRNLHWGSVAAHVNSAVTYSDSLCDTAEHQQCSVLYEVCPMHTGSRGRQKIMQRNISLLLTKKKRLNSKYKKRGICDCL